MTHWDHRFLALARLVSTWSKDPSTQVGAAISDERHRIVSVGFNGLPTGLADLPERLEDRNLKYSLILHAEDNALAFASRTVGCTLYTWPLMPCSRCMARAIQHGIVRVVTTDRIPARWADDFNLSVDIAQEAGIAVDIYPERDLDL